MKPTTQKSKQSSIDLFFSNFLTHSQRYPEEVPSYSQIYTPEWELVAESFNQVEKKSTTTFHSEVLCIQKAQDLFKNKYLYHYNLLTILEPCTMCTGSIIQSRLGNVFYFAELEKIPGISSFSPEFIVKSNHFPKLEFLPRQEASEILKKFFSQIRERG